jgi:hypothetical protein
MGAAQRLSTGLVVLSLIVLPHFARAEAVRQFPGLISITFWESSDTEPRAFTFRVNSRNLTTRRNDPLSETNSDFSGVRERELYDVFYSNADGTFNVEGEFLTVEAVFDRGLPAGGGLNLAEIGLNFVGASVGCRLFVESFVALGNNAIPGSEENAVDGDLRTHTTMGNTVGQSERLRITLGFRCVSPPGVGGSVRGINPTRVTCQNVTTAQTVVIRDDRRSWDCEAAGLLVQPGHVIRQTVVGSVD